MLIRPLSCITEFISTLNQALKQIAPAAALTLSQRTTLGAILLGIIVTESINWAAFERRSLSGFKQDQLRWFFYRAKIRWHQLLQASVKNILVHYNLHQGVLVIDDTDKKRSQNTTQIPGVHTIKDKKTDGYFQGQELVFMILVTEVATFPVDFRFYTPDPHLSAWKKKNKALKRQGVPASQRPVRPEPNREKYPTKQALALNMLRDFVSTFDGFKVQGVLADALYGEGRFMDEASAITGQAQVLSQLRHYQRCSSRNSQTSLKDYFSRQSGVETELILRGGEKKPIVMLAARLKIKSHGKRRYVIALKYSHEKQCRYLVATDLSWRHQDIASLYSLRWLVEVFIQDWKCHGGWNRLTKQQGEEGSTRGVILSLLCDHLLLLHPEQSVRLKNKQPGLPVGCLTEHLKAQALIETVTDIVNDEQPRSALEAFHTALKSVLPQRASKKHMVGRDLGRMEPTPSLRYRAKVLLSQS